MKRWVVVAGSSLGLTVAMLSLLLAALSISLQRLDALLFYGALSLACFALVTWLLRRDRRERRAREALLPPELRLERRVPRTPIRMPVIAATLVFIGWYVAALVVTLLIEGRLLEIHYAAIAPFAAFLLTMLTFTAHHVLFRLGAEDDDRAGDRRGPPG